MSARHDWGSSLRERTRGVSRDESGSILPMVLGYAMLAIALIIVTTAITSLYITQKRIDGVAAAAALAGSDGFTLTVDGDTATARLSDDEVWNQALAIVEASVDEVVLISATTQDGVTAHVEVAVEWHPPLISALLPSGFTLTATATSRTALDDD